MQTGNGSASSGDQWISVTGVGCCAAEVIGTARAVLEQRVDQRIALAVRVATAVSRTAQRWRMSASAADAGLRSHHLLKDQHVAGLEIRIGAEQRRLGGPLRQAAIGVAPGVELHLVVLGKELRILHRLEDDARPASAPPFVAGADRQ